MFRRFNPNQPMCAPVPVWAWMLVRLRQECDAILKNRKRFCRSGKKILTWGWSGNQGNIFFKRAKPEMNGQKQKRLKGCLTAFLAHLPRQLAEEHRVQNWLVRYLLQERNYPWGPLDIQGTPLNFSPQAQNNSSENK